MADRKERTNFDRRFPSIPCTRCKEDRWPSGSPDPLSFVCQRCQAAQGGRGVVVDPTTGAVKGTRNGRVRKTA